MLNTQYDLALLEPSCGPPPLCSPEVYSGRVNFMQLIHTFTSLVYKSDNTTFMNMTVYATEK